MLSPFSKILEEKTLKRIESMWIAAGITDPAWEQLQKHMQLVAASGYILAKLVQIPDPLALVQAGLLHDVCKRREIESLAPTAWTVAHVNAYAKQQEAYLESHAIAPEIIQIITDHGSELIFELLTHSEKVPLAQKVFLYTDNICASKGFVTLNERVDRLRKLYPQLNDLTPYGFSSSVTFGFYDLQLHVMHMLELQLARMCGTFSSDLHDHVRNRVMNLLFPFGR